MTEGLETPVLKPPVDGSGRHMPHVAARWSRNNTEESRVGGSWCLLNIGWHLVAGVSQVAHAGTDHPERQSSNSDLSVLESHAGTSPTMMLKCVCIGEVGRNSTLGNTL